MTEVAAPVIAPRETWEWFGSPGHLIVARDCRFHLCTLVGEWLVSTVGEYLPDESSREVTAQVRGITLVGRGDARRADYMEKIGFQEIGYKRLYETMVFHVGPEPNRCTDEECGCGIPRPLTWSEQDADGYMTAGDATRGHMAMCEKWSSRMAGENPDG